MDPAMRVSQSELFKILIIDPTETGKALKRALHFVTQNLNIYLTSQVNRDLFTLIDEICPLAILMWADENRKGVRLETVKNNWSYLPVIIFVSCGQRDGCLCG